MNNIIEMAPTGPDDANEKSYREYQELGGIINKKDYTNALMMAENTTILDKTRIAQAENIARFVGIELHNTENAIDQKIALYAILRSDLKPKEVEHHHSQMGDQRLFAEVLRMLGDVESLDKMIKSYPNIFLGDHEKSHEEYPKAA
ncbi:MAG: hypothetical protein A2431_00430 [Candidatus Zambryskibacteria bacterium RIFOXYC1_FULL_39_10]|uniref:Uncharacterized protein n=1 Tax=Candidatus Zambryskibacteria bacterium RIFOXYC1_FULL_39_10 TaxID=1802779 RepID=A0A1G2UZ55_9BACT|nr:MAG: hypothetical protein A2431_00430 [Candidatus Zambryskibacteria bacterium RIFOXYC1_FULL_39_10]OHB15611.1 MAG: hypothetical protein A2605_02290 [Candidatus Zambryskibacteria bacterium RIFOXYD1_FULL_39_35]